MNTMLIPTHGLCNDHLNMAIHSIPRIMLGWKTGCDPRTPAKPVITLQHLMVRTKACSQWEWEGTNIVAAAQMGFKRILKRERERATTYNAKNGKLDH